MPQVTFKIEKQAPTITVTNGSSENLELFHGIGNTLGFNITGGSDFSMPITIFHVSRQFSSLAVWSTRFSSACSICKRSRTEERKAKKKVIRNSMVADERKLEIESTRKLVNWDYRIESREADSKTYDRKHFFHWNNWEWKT